MSSESPICLEFGSDIADPVRSRMSYAFRLFAAIYSYKVVPPDSSRVSISCVYGGTTSKPRGSREFSIPARYRFAPVHSQVTKPEKRRYADEDVHLFYGINEATGTPDWLGEIFEWVSLAQEWNVTDRDSVGRIRYSDTVFGQNGISPRKPHAAILMSWMESALRRGNSDGMPAKPPSPLPGVDHIVVASHDIDFYSVSRMSTLVRLVKNLAISIRVYKSRSFFLSNASLILDVAGGNAVGDYLPRLMQAIEDCDFRSTLFVVARKAHRRDPNYDLAQIARSLRQASQRGFPVELHGSYTSINEEATLLPEVTAMDKVMVRRPVGSRQHWLRFDRHEKLYQALEDARLVFDSTLGFADVAGFRNGASFAFPPYNLKEERPCEFLEIPLALMDGNLEADSRTSRQDPQAIADELLGQSRKWGWGGVSILWHNPIEATSVPDEINRVFWKCAREQRQRSEKWMPATEFLDCCLPRYRQAGLLLGVSAHAKSAAG